MGLAFQRMYVDLPPDTKVRLKARAAERGMSMKGLVAKLIEEDCKPSKKPATRSKKRGKKKATNRRK